MKELFEEVDLAFYLTALNRSDDAMRVASFICDLCEFTGNYNLWTPVGYALCLKTRLCRLGADLASARSTIERLYIHLFQDWDVSPEVQEMAVRHFVDTRLLPLLLGKIKP